MKRILLGLSVLVVGGAGLAHKEIAGTWRAIGYIKEQQKPKVCAAQVMSGAAPQLRVLPTRYVADRFFATPVTESGDTLLLFIDSGGGSVFVTKPTLERLGATPKYLSREDGEQLFTGAPFPKFNADASIPAPLCNGGAFDFGLGASDKMRMPELEGAVGMLGNTWFAGRVWVYDYPRQTLAVYDAPPPPQPFGPHTIPMTLRLPPVLNHPRIQVDVEGDTIDMLLDTGATSMLSPAAVQTMGGVAAIRGSAFVATRLWERWRSAHPSWRVITAGESSTKADLIEVPSLTIAGYPVGPVWFAKRTNQVYDGMMAGVMDKPILASIGGPAFRTFRITMDYANQRATFER